jgi:hypothetical protein
MNQRDHIENIKKILKDADGEFRILEHQVPLETQMEYFFYSNSLRSLLPDDAVMDFEQFATVLLNPASSLPDKKKVLSALAASKEARAYRILQEYVQEPDLELKDWAHLALMESRVMLESEFTNERQIYISTGLGGKGNRLRFYVLLLSSSGNQFLGYQQQVIEKEFAYALAKEEGEIEEFTIKENYIELTVLLPIQTNIKRFIENVISECNQYGNFISNTVTVTNVKKLAENEIAQIIKKHENIRTGS